MIHKQKFKFPLAEIHKELSFGYTSQNLISGAKT
jgi:hypothetical protein